MKVEKKGFFQGGKNRGSGDLIELRRVQLRAGGMGAQRRKRDPKRGRSDDFSGGTGKEGITPLSLGAGMG